MKTLNAGKLQITSGKASRSPKSLSLNGNVSSARLGSLVPRARAPVLTPSGPATPSVACRAASLQSNETKVNLDSDVLDAVIVGAGISGMTAAQALVTKHSGTVKKFVVTEARDRVGGNITTMEGNGYLWEEGPNSFQPNDSILEAAVDAGCVGDLVLGDPTAPRFVFWEGRLRPTPSGPDVVTFDLMSPLGKIRAGLGAAGIRPPPPPGVEETVEQFVRRNLGDEVFFRLIEPFCSGVYSGDPKKLSMKAAFGRVWNLEEKGGSIIGGALKFFQEKRANPDPPRDPKLPPKPKGQTVGSFRKGLKTLPEKMAQNVGSDRILLSWKLKSITRGDNGVYNLAYDTPQGAKTIKARTVALTVPAYVAADVLKAQSTKAAQALNSFDYPPVAAVTVAVPMTAIREDRKDSEGKLPGFGQLHPRTQGIVTLGTIYSSTLFPGRCPEKMQLLLCYIGGALNRGILDQTEDQILAQIDKDLRVMLLKEDAPTPTKVAVRVWPKAIPQFNVGHGDLLAAAESGLKEAGLDGVLLGGNYVSGVALGKCIEYGYQYAKDIAARSAAVAK